MSGGREFHADHLRDGCNASIQRRRFDGEEHCKDGPHQFSLFDGDAACNVFCKFQRFGQDHYRGCVYKRQRGFTPDKVMGRRGRNWRAEDVVSRHRNDDLSPRRSGHGQQGGDYAVRSAVDLRRQQSGLRAARPEDQTPAAAYRRRAAKPASARPQRLTRPRMAMHALLNDGNQRPQKAPRQLLAGSICRLSLGEKPGQLERRRKSGED